MPDTLLPIVIVAALLLILAGGLFFMRRQRTERLRERFGPEYDRTVSAVDDRAKAETELAAREQRVAALQISPLGSAEQQRFADAWRTVQNRFVDDPSGAVGDADRLVTEVMQARGYPMGEFEQRAADISVDHAELVQHYRSAHDVALRDQSRRATTEDLRQAMVDYRALFEDLLGPSRVDESRVDQQLRTEEARR